MHIAIIGGGLMGISLAYFLTENGRRVTVLEQSTAPGGFHSAIQLEDGLSVPPYPHGIFPGDTHTLELINQLGLHNEVRFRSAHTGFLHHGKIHPLRTLWDFLTFSPLRLRDRLRLGQTIIQARMTSDWRELDHIPVREWLVRAGGERNFDHIWAPLLEAKFDHFYDNVPATFIWSWLKRASGQRGGPRFSASLAYLRQGPTALIRAMTDAIQARGGEIRTQTRVREIEVYGDQLGRVRTSTGMLDFDVVVSAVPTPDFSRLLLSADEDYLRQLGEIPYLDLICPALVLDQPLSDYWTINLTDPTSPFSTIVQMPCPGQDGTHVVYLPKYTAPENDWMGVPDETIREAWLLRLRQIYPSLKAEHIRHFIVSRARYVDPLHFVDATRRIPSIRTPYRGLYLVNTSQVYPNLPTSEAVIDHARHIAKQLVEQREQRPVAEPVI